MSTGSSVIFKNPRARKPLRVLTELFDSKQKTKIHWVNDTNQRARQTNQEICCGRVFQREEKIKNQ